MVFNIFYVFMYEMYFVFNYIYKFIYEIISILYLYFERMKVFFINICWKVYFKLI